MNKRQVSEQERGALDGGFWVIAAATLTIGYRQLLAFRSARAQPEA
jgi:hypothetical protein